MKYGVHKYNPSIKIYGGDIDGECVGKYFVDKFWKMPRINQLSSEEVLSYCKDNNIGIIIPTRDGELEYFSRAREELGEHGVFVAVSARKSIIDCLDKLAFANLKNIYAIPASETIDDILANAYVVKERYGAGSRSIGIELNRAEAVNHARGLNCPIFQPFLEGSEISVDSYISQGGVVKGIIMRTRDLVVEGESQVTSTFSDDGLKNHFESIFGSLDLYGHVILQALITKEGGIHVIECNPRFGGASTLSVRAGLDSFYWMYLESQGISLTDYPFVRIEKEMTQIRHPKDLYI